MIRFIEMTGLNEGERAIHFGFWDTVRDRFIDFDGYQAFESVSDWEEAAAASYDQEGVTEEWLQRCRSLIPTGWGTASSRTAIVTVAQLDALTNEERHEWLLARYCAG